MTAGRAQTSGGLFLFKPPMMQYISICPAEVMKAYRDEVRDSGIEKAAEALVGFIDSLVYNDSESCPDTFRELAEKYVQRAAERSAKGRASVKARWDKKNKPEPQPEPPKAPAKPKPEKHALDQGGFVRVTVDEESALRVKFGLDFGRAVQILADYKESKGKVYKSDAAAMRGWVYDRIQEDKRRTAPQKSFQQQERERQGALARSLMTEEQKRRYGIVE